MYVCCRRDLSSVVSRGEDEAHFGLWNACCHWTGDKREITFEWYTYMVVILKLAAKAIRFCENTSMSNQQSGSESESDEGLQLSQR